MARPPDFEKYKQDPADVLDYENDWRDLSEGKPFLGESEVIVSSTWTVYDTGWDVSDDAAIDSTAPSFTDTTTKVWVSEGVLGKTVYLTNHIVTDEGREKDDTIAITFEEQ